MAYPVKPDATYDYTTFQAGNPTTPLPADQVEAGFNDHKQAIDDVIEFIKTVIRSDGRLNNLIVTPESLSTASRALITAGGNVRGAWATTTAYAVGDVVSEDDASYICAASHISGTFAIDYTVGKWIVLSTAQIPGAAAVQTVRTMSELEGLVTRPETFIVSTGRSAGSFRWDEGASTDVDGVIVVEPGEDGEAGRYKRISSMFYFDENILVSGAASAKNYGAYLSSTATGATTDFAWAAAYINIAESLDNGDGATGSCVNGLFVNHSTIGAPTLAGQGSRNSIWAIYSHDAATSGIAAEGKDFYTGIFTTVAVNVDDGGGLGTEKGNFYGFGSIVTAKTGVEHLRSVVGAEFDVVMEVGSSSTEKIVLQLVTVNSDAEKGSVVDAALLICGDLTVTAQLDYGIAFGKPGSMWNVDGKLMGVYPTVNAMEAKSGVDFSGVAFSEFFLKHDGFSVSGAGEVVASGQVLSNTGLAIVNAFGSVAFYEAADGVAWRFITAAGALLLQRAIDGETWSTTPVTFQPDGDAVFAADVEAAAFRVSGSKVVGARDTGWTAMTGTPDESTVYATGSVTLPQLAGRVMALQAALTTHGLIGV